MLTACFQNLIAEANGNFQVRRLSRTDGGMMGSGFRLKVEGFEGAIFWVRFGFQSAKLGFFGINLGSLWLYLGSFWVRFFTIVNNDGQSLGSFFQKNFFLRPEDRSEKTGTRIRGAEAGCRPDGASMPAIEF
jgi:hypothetical protein